MSRDFEKLRNLILKQEIDKLDEIIEKIQKLENLQEQETLVENLSNLIAQILSKNIQNNQNQIYTILHPLISKALKSDLQNSKWELTKLLSPIISSSIKEQVHKQKDTIVDALYPIMGNMISRYVTNSIKEMMYEINEKLQNSLSFNSLKRKIKSKVYNISEAKLLMQELNFFKIDSIFLIHRDSGLLIVEAHREDGIKINEPEMVASMLSAIRSFVNDWISSNNKMSEINEIEYGNSSILIESAGSCYLAIVARGEADFKVKEQIALSLSNIISLYGLEILEYSGDSSRLNIENIKEILSELFYQNTHTKKQNKKFPFLSTIILICLILSPISWQGYNYYKEYLIKQNEEKIIKIIKESNIKIYDLNLKSDEKKRVKVTGLVLTNKEKINLEKKLVNLKVITDINSIDESFSKKYRLMEFQKIVKSFNEKYNSNLKYKINSSVSKIIIKGTLINKQVKEEFMEYIKSLFVDIDFKFDIKELPKLKQRVYFELASFEVLEKYNNLLDNITILINNNKNYLIKITGYTDDLGSFLLNEKLAIKRAESIKEELIKRGVDRKSIQVDSMPTPPEDVSKVPIEKQKELSRCVIFNWEIKK